MTGHDLGNPARSAINTASVTVRVNRNLNAPVFLITVFEKTIVQNMPSQASVFQVLIIDNDLVVGLNFILLTNLEYAHLNISE